MIKYLLRNSLRINDFRLNSERNLRLRSDTNSDRNQSCNITRFTRLETLRINNHVNFMLNGGGGGGSSLRNKPESNDCGQTWLSNTVVSL